MGWAEGILASGTWSSQYDQAGAVWAERKENKM